MISTHTPPSAESVEIAKLVLDEVKEKNASCIKTFEVLNTKAAFCITTAVGFATVIGSIMVFSANNGFYYLFVAATLIFLLLFYILLLLFGIVRPTDITHQGDTPVVIRSYYIEGETTYLQMLRGMTDFYGEKIRINETGNIVKAKKLRRAIRLLIFAPYLFFAVYVVVKVSQLLLACRDFLG